MGCLIGIGLILFVYFFVRKKRDGPTIPLMRYRKPSFIKGVDRLARK
jgi:hypothetical protein